MDYSKNHVGNLILVSILFIVGLLYIFLRTPDISTRLSSFQYYQQCPQSITNETATMVTTTHQDELETALDGASMRNNKTVIIAIVNKAYVEGETTMLSLFLESFWLGDDTRPLLNHLLLVTVDQVSFDRCKFLRLHCYRLATEGVDFGGEKLYNSYEFKKMMWRRTQFLSDVLKRGYSFIFTDADVMWLRSPLTRLVLNKTENEADIQMSCDNFDGDPWSGSNGRLLNTGYYYVRSNNKTISLFDTWYKMKDDPHHQTKKDQDALKILYKWGVLTQLGLKIRFLDTLYFSGFCQDSKDLKVVSTVHANCCRSIDAKVADLTVVLREWRKFKMMRSTTTTTNETWSPHLECLNSWKRKIKV